MLKICGDVESPGLLSFPIPGASLALDFPFVENKTLPLFEQLDEVVLDAGGGRRCSEDTVDHACGITHLAGVGDELRPGEIIARLHHGNPSSEAEWISRIRAAITLVKHPVEVPQRLYKEIN